MIRGVLFVLRIMMAFSMERVSAGSPSFFQVSSYDSVLKKVLKLNSLSLIMDSHS